MNARGGAYNCYFGRMNTGKMKIRGVMARKGPEYVNKMQHEVFEVLAQARSLEDLKRIEPKPRAHLLKKMRLEGTSSRSSAGLPRKIQ